MLHFQTVEPTTLSLLKKLQRIPALNSFHLVGDTALALKYGHRISIDIDLFGNNFDEKTIVNALHKEFGVSFEYEKTHLEWGLFCFIENVKVDIIAYQHPLLQDIETPEYIRMLSTLDIAAMKVNAILGRGSKKDFWDINEILKHFSMEEIINAHSRKFPQQMLLISIPQALTYFQDADESLPPVCLNGLKWKTVKKNISKKVNEYLS